MKECICCRDRLVKHLSHSRMYWFCPSCRQEMIFNQEPTVYSLTKFSKQKLSLDRTKRNWNQMSA